MEIDEITIDPYIQKKIASIHQAKSKILKLPINNLSEYRLRNYSLFTSVYYSLFLSGVQAYEEDVRNLIFGDKPVKMDPDKAIAYLNYTKVTQYIHAYYNKTSAELSLQFVSNINRTLFLNSVNSPNSGIYNTDLLTDGIRLQDKLQDLYEFIESNEGIDPLLKAAIFYINFVKLNPFKVGNGRTARALTLFYLFRSGYALAGFFAPEKYFALYRGRKFNSTLSVAIKSDLVKDIIPFTKFFLYCLNESANTLYRYVKDPSLIDLDDSYTLLNERQRKLIDIMLKTNTISLSTYLSKIKGDTSQATRDFDKLRELGFIEKKGLGKSTYYVLRKKP